MGRPNLQAYAERWVQSIGTECLDRFVVLCERHLRYLARGHLDYYHAERPHQGLDNRPLDGREATDDAVPVLGDVRVVRRLGGLLHHLERRAAQSATQLIPQTSCRAPRRASAPR